MDTLVFGQTATALWSDRLKGGKSTAGFDSEIMHVGEHKIQNIGTTCWLVTRFYFDTARLFLAFLVNIGFLWAKICLNITT